jgi:Protein of unknown function, DUF481
MQRQLLVSVTVAASTIADRNNGLTGTEQGNAMKIAAVIAFVAFLFAGPLLARDKSDVLVMNNGDRITCEIKGLDAGVLYVSFDYIKGTTEVDWLKVHHIQSKQLFLVKTQDGNAYIGTLSTAETEAARPIHIEIVESPENTVTVERRQVVDMFQTSDNFWHRLNGEINSGMTYSKANASRQYNFSSNADYPRERWTAGAAFTSTLTANTGATTSTLNNIQMYYRHLMRWNNWFYTGVGRLLQSAEQDIALQSTVGGGIGRYLKNTNHATIALYGGLAYQNARFTETATHQPIQNTAAALAAVSADLFKFNKTNLTVQGSVLPSINQPGRVFGNINTTYYFKFWSNFTWNLSFYGNWDSEPPATFSGSNYGTSAGLGWTFGNK